MKERHPCVLAKPYPIKARSILPQSFRHSFQRPCQHEQANSQFLEDFRHKAGWALLRPNSLSSRCVRDTKVSNDVVDAVVKRLVLVGTGPRGGEDVATLTPEAQMRQL